MNFFFDIDKSIAASAYLIQKNKGVYTVLFLVKSLYYANRGSLVKHGRSITGDRFISMKNGPNVSETYDLANGSKHAKPEHLSKWKSVISREGCTMKLVSGGEPHLGYLSGREIQLLDEAFAVI